MQDPVIPFDLHRMFLGDAPPLFLLEVLFRTVVVYAYALIMIRWIGGRSVAQMSVVEFLLVIALGSAVGDAMFYPQVPLLHAFAVITVVVLINKLLDTLIYHHPVAERAIDGRDREVVRDGLIDRKVLRYLRLGQSELHEALRREGIDNLGQVSRAFVEKSGHITAFRKSVATPGLPIVPPFALKKTPTLGPDTAIPEGTDLLCMDCARPLDTARTRTPVKCDHCGGTTWTEARMGSDHPEESTADAG